MFGIFFIALSSLSTELGTSLAKRLTEKNERRIYTAAFAAHLGALALLVLVATLLPAQIFSKWFETGFVFSAASLPFLLPRIAVEILLAHITQLAIARADRSTFGFLRTFTLPLLLVVDVLLGYTIRPMQMGGIALIIAALVLLFAGHAARSRGVWLSFASAVLAVVTVSLYKYDITHFNSVAAEQIIVYGALVLYFLFMAIRYGRENPFVIMLKPTYGAQFVLGMVNGVAVSFAFVFAPASIVLAAKRSFSVLFAVASGRMYFHEKHIVVKILCIVLVVAGVVALTF